MCYSFQFMNHLTSVIDESDVDSVMLLTKKRKLSVQDVSLPKKVSIINY